MLTPPIHLGHPEGVKRSFITVPNVNDTLHKGPKKDAVFLGLPLTLRNNIFVRGTHMLLVVGSVVGSETGAILNNDVGGILQQLRGC